QVGGHGWAPQVRQMHGHFSVYGPRLEAGTEIPAFENIDVYPFIMEILGLKITGRIDGNPATLVPLLR
ncbi:MAG: alkaline phosphatase family protein, partial [Pseudomonadota bacterium]